jgi:hypothetical protein
MANKVAYSRRGSNDPKWKETKAAVDARDKRQCRLMMCLSITESKQLKVGTERTLDRAHIFAASNRPDIIYNPNNVVTLTRFVHRRMDNFQNPLNGDPIDRETHYYWWWRIFSRSIEKFNSEIDYEQLLLSKIK